MRSLPLWPLLWDVCGGGGPVVFRLPMILLCQTIQSFSPPLLFKRQPPPPCGRVVQRGAFRVAEARGVFLLDS